MSDGTSSPESSPASRLTHTFCLTLLLVGFAWPATLLPPPVVSYTTVSPSPQSLNSEGISSLLHLPSGFPARPLAGTMLFGVRTFLSLLPNRDRPANLVG